MIPPFVEQDTDVVVNTETFEYVERALTGAPPRARRPLRRGEGQGPANPRRAAWPDPPT